MVVSRLHSVRNSKPVRSLAITASRDESVIATGAEDGVIRLFSQEAAAEPFTSLREHKDWVWALAFSVDGKFLASGGGDCKLNIFNLDALTSTQIVGTGRVVSVQFSSSGKCLAAATDKGTVRVWSTNTDWSTLTWSSSEYEQDFGQPVCAVSFIGKDDDWLVVSTNMSAIFFDNWRSKQKSFAAAGAAITATPYRLESRHPLEKSVPIAWCPQGPYLATGGSDTLIRLWPVDLEYLPGLGKITPDAEFCGHEKSVSALAFSPHGDFLASVGLDGKVMLWSMESRKLVYSDTCKRPLLAVAFASETMFVCAGLSGELFTYRLDFVHA